MDFTYRNIIKSVSPILSNDKKVLDIGSATGTLCFYLASKVLSIDGIELSLNAYRQAKLNKNKLGVKNVNFINSSIEEYKTDKKYDLVMCFEVLEHIENDLLVLQKINKMMKENSTFVISIPSKNAPLHKLGMLIKFDKRVGHLRRYSFDEIGQKINLSGFEIVRSFKYEGILRNFLFTNNFFGQLIIFTKLSLINYLFTKADNFLLNLFGESQIILICKKR